MAAITLRTSISANDNQWAAVLYDKQNYYKSKTYDIHIVDRIGGGDSFNAGLIYSLLTGKILRKRLSLQLRQVASTHIVGTLTRFPSPRWKSFCPVTEADEYSVRGG